MNSPAVMRNGNTLTLYANGLAQSRIDLARPEVLCFPYLRWMAGIVSGNTSTTRNVLHVGGGLVSLPQHLAHTLQLHSVVYELDRDLVSYCQNHLRLHHLVEVRTGDGVEAVKKSSPGTVGAIVVDAFDPMSSSIELFSLEFFAACRTALSPDGRLVVNVASVNSLHLDRVASGITAAFPEVGCLYVSGKHSSADIDNAVFWTVNTTTPHELTPGLGFSYLLAHDGATPYEEREGHQSPRWMTAANTQARLDTLSQLLELCHPDDSYRPELELVAAQLRAMLDVVQRHISSAGGTGA